MEAAWPFIPCHSRPEKIAVGVTWRFWLARCFSVAPVFENGLRQLEIC